TCRSYTYLIMFRRILLLAVLVLTGCAAEMEQQPAAEAEAAQTAHGRVGSHGMVLVGAPGAAFLSHVPMFHAPHDVQLLLAVRLDGASLPSSFSDRLFTFLPDALSIDDLRLGALKKMRGTVFLVCFDDGGTAVA